MTDLQIRLGRRSVMAGLALLGTVPALAAPSPRNSLLSLASSPILALFYRRQPQGQFTSNGLAKYNTPQFRSVEWQRYGTEWILRWALVGIQSWRDFGWKMLDHGLAYQQRNGGFEHGNFHINSIFIEALATACLLDPQRASRTHIDCIVRGCAWLTAIKAEKLGMELNAPYTHRRYLLASTLGKSAAVTGQAALASRARVYCEEGLALQRSTGINPENGGFDVSYQMSSVWFAAQYYAFADDALRAHLRRMIRLSIDYELHFIAPSGAINTSGSTRVGQEKVYGNTKLADAPTIFQALAYADGISPHEEWRSAAIAVARYAKLPYGSARGGLNSSVITNMQ